MNHLRKSLLVLVTVSAVVLLAVSCQTATVSSLTQGEEVPAAVRDLEQGDITSFEVIAASTEGHLDVAQDPAGVQLYGRAAFGNFVQYTAMVPMDGLDLEMSLDALEDNASVDNWFAIGLLSRQGFLTGDSSDVSAEGVVLLARMSETEAGSHIGFQIVKNPGLTELAMLNVPYTPGKVYTIQMKASGEGYVLAVNDQRAILSYDDVASDLYRGSKGFLFFATHSDNNGDLRGTVRRIGDTTFAQY